MARVLAFDMSHFEMSWLNDVAPRNMPNMFVAPDTSHFDISLLNAFLFLNKLLISVTRDTSHSPIGPCVPLTQAPTGDNSMHASTALWSSALDLNTAIKGMCVGLGFDRHALKNTL